MVLGSLSVTVLNGPLGVTGEAWHHGTSRSSVPGRQTLHTKANFLLPSSSIKPFSAGNDGRHRHAKAFPGTQARSSSLPALPEKPAAAGLAFTCRCDKAVISLKTKLLPRSCPTLRQERPGPCCHQHGLRIATLNACRRPARLPNQIYEAIKCRQLYNDVVSPPLPPRPWLLKLASYHHTYSRDALVSWKCSHTTSLPFRTTSYIPPKLRFQVLLPRMSLPSHFPLRAANGKTIQIPSVGYGTWASGENSWAKDAVLTALKEGYRHLDCAWMYGVDESIGEAIRESGVPREEIFITSKVSTSTLSTREPSNAH